MGANKNKYQKKNNWGVCERIIPLKPQSCPKMVFLTASSRLSYGNKIEKIYGTYFLLFLIIFRLFFQNDQIISPPPPLSLALVPLNRFHDLYGNTPLLSVEYYFIEYKLMIYRVHIVFVFCIYLI